MCKSMQLQNIISLKSFKTQFVIKQNYSLKHGGIFTSFILYTHGCNILYFCPNNQIKKKKMYLAHFNKLSLLIFPAQMVNKDGLALSCTITHTLGSRYNVHRQEQDSTRGRTHCPAQLPDVLYTGVQSINIFFSLKKIKTRKKFK